MEKYWYHKEVCSMFVLRPPWMSAQLMYEEGFAAVQVMCWSVDAPRCVQNAIEVLSPRHTILLIVQVKWDSLAKQL